MRMSRLFSQTLRQAPADAEVASHRLLLRAGFIRQLGAGIFSYLPLARRALTKIENIMREEIGAIGGQEITMPVVNPADVWKATGRWAGIGAEMGRFVDRTGRDMALAMTHEEVVADLVRQEIRSYRQLPQLVYHIQTKWRDDPRPRAGLIRVREFTMLDSYSLDADRAGLDRQYDAHYQAYFNIFRRCGLPVHAVKSDVGMMSGRTPAILARWRPRCGPSASDGTNRKKTPRSCSAPWPGAPPPQRGAVLRLLAASPASDGLQALREAGKDPDATVRDAAFRTLCDWPNAEAAAGLLALARDSSDPTRRILALRGAIRLAGLKDVTPARKVALIAEAATLAKGEDEKKMLLGLMQGVFDPRVLTLAVGYLGDPRDRGGSGPGGRDDRRTPRRRAAHARAEGPSDRQGPG